MHARRLAMEKSARAAYVASGFPGLSVVEGSRTTWVRLKPDASIGLRVVLAADTAVVVDGAILGKPAGRRWTPGGCWSSCRAANTRS